MLNETVITNLRIPQVDWVNVRSNAGELGLSTNEYIKRVLQLANNYHQFGIVANGKKRASIWDLPKLARLPNKPMGASEEDKIIYGL